MKKAEILAKCIEEIRSGKSTVEDCISRYPEFGKALRSILEISTSLKPDNVTASPEFTQRTKSRLLHEMQPKGEKIPRRSWHWPALKPLPALTYVLAVVFIVVIVGGGTAYATQGSLPGDPLYPVKTGVENIQLVLTPGAIAKANLHIKLALRRIDEANQQTSLNRNINAEALQTINQQFDEAIKEIGNADDEEARSNALSQLSVITLNQQLELEQVLTKVSDADKKGLKEALDTTRRTNLIAQVAYSNHDLLKSQPSVSDATLDEGYFNIDGVLISIQDSVWNIGGVILHDVHCPVKVPAVGTSLKLTGLVNNGEVFVTHVEVSNSTTYTTKIEGQFGGTNANGTSQVAGITINIADGNATQLHSGDNVQLQGDANDKELQITGKENDEGNTQDGTELDGSLLSVNIIDSTVTISSSGNKITINAAEAQIENGNGKAITLSALNSFVGREVMIKDLHKRDSVIYAGRIQIEEGD